MRYGPNAKKEFQKMLEKACKDSVVTPKELLRELVSSGYKNIYDMEITLDELKSVCDDLEDSKEIAELWSHKSGVRTDYEISD